MDIASWIQCFATYVSVMSTSHLQAVPELLAYPIFILRVSQDFGGVVTYDSAFRRQAFITGNRQWSKINPTLYSICFSGVARVGQRFELCLSLLHPNRECTLVSDPDLDVSTRLKILESAVLAFTLQPVPPPMIPPPPRARSAEVCRNFNAGKCRMPTCRFRDVCKVCGDPDPAISCCDRQLGLRAGDYPQSSTRWFATSVSQSEQLQTRRFVSGTQMSSLNPQGPERANRAHTGSFPY